MIQKLWKNTLVLTIVTSLTYFTLAKLLPHLIVWCHKTNEHVFQKPVLEPPMTILLLLKKYIIGWEMKR